MAMNSEDLQLLVTRVMPYGKYKGHLIADLPGRYLNWFAREGFPSGEIGRLLALCRSWITMVYLLCWTLYESDNSL